MTSQIQGWTPDQLGSLDGKTYVITGTTSGTGFEAARILLANGARVVTLNRNPVKSDAKLADLHAEFGPEAPAQAINLDLASLDSVRAAASQVLDQCPKIDALICNAAIGQIAKQELTEDGFESQFAVNHLGHFLLTGLLFDQIEQSQGRVVVMGSNGYKMGTKAINFDDINHDEKYSPWAVYAHAKMAQMMFAYELQRRVQAAGKKAQIHVCHPGASQTNLIGERSDKMIKFVWSLMSRFTQPAEKGAWPAVMCATADSLKPFANWGPTKWGEMSGPVGECSLEPFVLDQQMAAKLWGVSCEMTKLDWRV